MRRRRDPNGKSWAWALIWAATMKSVSPWSRRFPEDAWICERCVLLESADAATVASSLLEWRRPVILVDAADMDLAPGEYRFFSDRDASVILKDQLGFHPRPGLGGRIGAGQDAGLRSAGLHFRNPAF